MWTILAEQTEHSEGDGGAMWLRVIKSGLLLIVGVAIAFNGLLVSVSPALIQSAYGVTSQDADVVALLRHRAVLL